MGMTVSNSLYPVVLSGGSGTRLWPTSRTSMPKQYVNLIGQSTLFSETVKRLQLVSNQPPIVVTNEEHRFLAAEELRKTESSALSIILEPLMRNTAPAIALAAFQAIAHDEDAVILVCPSDHLINDAAEFATVVAAAVALAEQNKIVTFGCKPSYAETGYGYIKVKSSSSETIQEFVEKPNQEKADEYVQSGNYYWNAGIFLAKASVFLNELEQHSTDIFSACKNAWDKKELDGDFTRVSKQDFFKCPADSIDYAIMEKTSNAVMVPLDSGWSDLGSWESVWRAMPQDANGNASQGDVHFFESKDNFVSSPNKLVAILGCKDLVVVEAGDSIMIAEKSHTQDVKEIVNALRQQDRAEVDTHARVFRPWGDYEGVDKGERYQVKRIVVKPGEQLSLQMHHHRAEHWTVVRGTAIVTIGEQKILLSENQSTYIPLGEIHRLENPGSIPLELIEVQSGSYLGEDDIVRLEDKYGRRKNDSTNTDSPAQLKLVDNRNN